jgi:hypothetical protein
VISIEAQEPTDEKVQGSLGLCCQFSWIVSTREHLSIASSLTLKSNI